MFKSMRITILVVHVVYETFFLPFICVLLFSSYLKLNSILSSTSVRKVVIHMHAGLLCFCITVGVELRHFPLNISLVVHLYSPFLRRYREPE